MRRLFVYTLITALIFTACQQELDDVIPEIQQKCKIVTGYYYGGSGMMNDSTVFSYDGNKVVRADAYDSYVIYSYTGNNITGRKFYYNPDNRLFQIDTIQYDANNKISKVTSWYYDDPFWWDTARVVLSFNYNGTALNKITEASSVFTPLGTEEDTIVNVFHYNGAGNIDKLVFTDTQNMPWDSLEYEYDTNPNYFSIAHPHFFLFDPYFQLHAAMLPHLPYFYSKNNVNKFIIYSTWDYNMSYGLDSLNKLTAIDMDGSEYVKYKYNCQ